MSVKHRWLMTALLAALTLPAAACKSDKDSKHAEKPRKSVKVSLIIRATRDSNDGRPLHVVVREVTRATFAEDDYSKVARLVVAPDDTVLWRLVVFPGQVYVLPLAFEEQPKAIGVYGLFTLGKGESWKKLAEYPREIEVWAGGSALERLRVQALDLAPPRK